MDNDRICAELYDEMEQPVAAIAARENVRRLRRALAGSRYEIVNHPTLGYELIVTDIPGPGTAAHTWSSSVGWQQSFGNVHSARELHA